MLETSKLSQWQTKKVLQPWTWQEQQVLKKAAIRVSKILPSRQNKEKTAIAAIKISKMSQKVDSKNSSSAVNILSQMEKLWQKKK